MGGQVPEHDAQLEDVKVRIADLFGWKCLTRPSQQFLAMDGLGRTLWLKARETDSGRSSTSWDWPKTDHEPSYNALIGILVSRAHEVKLIIRVMREDVDDMKHDNQGSYRLRWNPETAQDDRVQVIWPPATSSQSTSSQSTSSPHPQSAHPSTRPQSAKADFAAEGP